jgi:YVTN family beta-propeller protein
MSNSTEPLAIRLVALAVVLAAASSVAIAQQVIATIQLGKNNSPDPVAVNPATNKVYVSTSDVITPHSGMSVIDGATGSVIKTITFADWSWATAINSATNKIYTAVSNAIIVIDGTSDSIVKTLPVGVFPYAIAVNSVTNRIYVVDRIGEKLTVIDGTNDTVITSISVGSNPLSLAVNAAANQVYVANAASDNVTVINGNYNSVIKTITVGSAPMAIEFDWATNRVYVANHDSNNVTVIDPVHGYATTTVAAGYLPCSLAVDSTIERIYVANCGSDAITVIDNNNLVIKTVIVGFEPVTIASDPETHKIYVANYLSQSVSVIDANTLTVTSVPVGKHPWLLAVNAKANRVYVSNRDDGTIFVIENGMQFVPTTPCRLVDTRMNNQPIQGGTSASFVIPQLGGCGIPPAAAYSLNVAVVPRVLLESLTIWPTGQDQPSVATMQSLDGRIKANAAIVAAGYRAAVSVSASETTDVVLDINGYFTPASSATLAFYPVAPCRVADTRGRGARRGQRLRANQQRDFKMIGACNIPASAQAYSLNFTEVLPNAQGRLTVWPSGQVRPFVSTLNAPAGSVTANAAIVQAGTNGDISVWTSNDTDLVIDANGYFAPPTSAASGLSLYFTIPCRVLDTRQTGGFTIPVDFEHSSCNLPEAARAYVLNATVMPLTSLGYLTLWPMGPQSLTLWPVGPPEISTLNAYDGATTSNMAIVSSGLGGEIASYASDTTRLILDISSCFAP